MRLRWRFVCQSVDCRPEIEITFPLFEQHTQMPDLDCICGLETKRPYSRPALRELSKAEAVIRFGDGGLPKTWAQGAG
jgi:hypothetical protein